MINSQESPKVEKLDEMPDYETTDGVMKSNCSSDGSNLRTHPDNYLSKGDSDSWRGEVRRGLAGHGKARQSVARQGMVRQGIKFKMCKEDNTRWQKKYMMLK